MAEIIRTKSFDLAYRFVTETNLNIFLTGKAGTGKTTFLKYLRENSFKNTVVTAPTGVAAINAGGVTLHSLFQLPFAPFVPGKSKNENSIDSHSLLSKIYFHTSKRNLLRSIELLVIDETSMVASHTIDAIDTLLRSIRHRRNLPFGGVQILFIGDLYQLPPVVKNNEWEILKEYYPSTFFFDSIVLRECVPVLMELKEIFRQRDSNFVELLNGVRNNTLTPENLELLNSRLKRNFVPADDEGYITLTTHNAQSDYINKQKLDKIKARSKKFHAEIKGDFPENAYPAEYELELKPGAQVMFLRNDNETQQYFNGKIGTVTKLDDDEIYVRCKGEDHDILVNKYEWKNTNYTLNPDTREIVENELGSFVQYPLRLAWAITIHKSQGLTFDKLVVDAEHAFVNGQVYVALSRCTSLEGLVLTTPVNRSFLGAHESLKEWQGKNQDDTNLADRFQEARRSYTFQELQNIWFFSSWFYALNNLRERINEEAKELPGTAILWLKELMEKQKTLQDVAEKFVQRLTVLASENPDIENNEALQKRVGDAANYFSAEIKNWKEKFDNHPLSTDKRKVANKIDEALDDTAFAIHEILHRIEHCRKGFTLNEYLKSGKKIETAPKQIQSSYARVSDYREHESEIPNIVLYKRLLEMRNRIANEKNIPVYHVLSNKVLALLCQALPANLAELYALEGFSRAKANKYGKEIVNVVKSFCEENNIPQNFTEPRVKKKEKTAKPDSATVSTTVEYFRKGKTVSEIAAERNFAVSTIEGHLAQAIKHGSVKIEEVMPLEEAKAIAQHFPSNAAENISLNILKEKVSDNITYGKLKMVMAWLTRGNEN